MQNYTPKPSPVTKLTQNIAFIYIGKLELVKKFNIHSTPVHSTTNTITQNVTKIDSLRLENIWIIQISAPAVSITSYNIKPLM